MTDPVIPIEGDTSTDEAALNAKIDAELGLPPQPAKTDDGSGAAKTTDDDSQGNTSGQGDTGDEEDVEEQDTETDTGDNEEKPKVEPATPSNEDLFIKVEDADGVTHKISKLEDLPEDFSPKNNRQGLEILQQLQKLEQKQAEAEETARTQAEEAEFTKTKQEQFDAWDKEVTELAKAKRVDIKDTERIDAVFKNMNEINAARAKAGNPNLITSFEDALDKFEAKEAKDKAEQDKKNDNERAQSKASRIGRSSAAAGGGHYVYRAGSARTIDDVPLG